MSAEHFDVVVIGSGFAGSLIAMIARGLGYSVLLLEKGTHPRFVIGESSTPLTNLLLERIALEYNLPRLLPLTKWGTWQREYPQIGCGLKRGFTFFHHQTCKEFVRTPAHENELLVAASPHDGIADTHWYRPDFDHFLVCEAQTLGAEYRENVEVDQIMIEEDYVELAGTAGSAQLHVKTGQLIDASGPNGLLKQMLNLPSAKQPDLLPTEGLYTHFKDVPMLESLPEFQSGLPTPYPQDASAVHHCFDGGWIWVLRFNNGITSAGVSATPELAVELNFREGEAAWNRLLQRFPSIEKAFRGSKSILPFRHHAPLSFRLEQICGKNRLMLPSAAGFVDPLLSTGFPLSLLGILRVAEMLKNRETHYVPSLENYCLETFRDIRVVELLLGALFRNLGDAERFRWLSFLYFAPMLFCESVTRLGKRSSTAGFMMRDEVKFWGPAEALLKEVIAGGVATEPLKQRVSGIIAPFDLGGLLETKRANWYPADSKDLVRNAHKAGVNPAEMQEMLKRVGA